MRRLNAAPLALRRLGGFERAALRRAALRALVGAATSAEPAGDARRGETA